MRKYCVIFLIGFMLSHFLFGQQIYFNKKYDFGTCSGSCGIICIKGGGYLIAGEDSVCNQGKLTLLNLDTLGNVIWEKIYTCNPSYFYYCGFGGLISTKDGGYTVGGAVQDTTYITAFESYDNYVALWKFKANGDTEWVKQYIDTNTYAGAQQCKQTKDGGYILTGLYSSNANPSVGYALLMKTDSIGNMQWQKTYNYGTYNSSNQFYSAGYSIDITTDNGYLVGGYCTSGSVTGGSSFVLKTDSAGNVKWESTISTDGGSAVAATPDGGGIVVCPYATTSEPLDQLYLLKYSSTGSIQWQYKYGNAIYGNYPASILMLPDSNFIITGQTTTDSNKHVVGYITKIGWTGNMKWYGTYDIYKDTNDQNYLRDIKPTPDGGYVACGFAWPQLSVDGNEDVWVIKIDSNGCDTIGQCATNYTGIQEIQGESDNIKIYPNPSNGFFTVSLQTVTDKTQIEIYNILGQSIYQNKLNSNKTEINLSGQSAGIYLYRVVSENGECSGSGKVVIEK